jgi:hypothetical protein
MRMTSAKHPSVMKNSLPILSTLDFRYYSEDRLFICERSDLKGKRILGRVFNDACDEGFILRSHKTGREVIFCQSGTDYNNDGEEAGWRFEALASQDCDGVRVLIIND